MTKIVSINSSPKLGKDNIFIYLWKSYRSLNLFFRLYILTAILITIASWFFVNNTQIFRPHAITPTINSVYFSYDLTFGHNVKVKLIDINNNPVRNTEVILYPSPLVSVTDHNGEAEFTDVSSGSHLAVIKDRDGEVTKEISVGNSTVSEYTIKLNSAYDDDLLRILYVFLAILMLIVIGILALKRKSNSASKEYGK